MTFPSNEYKEECIKNAETLGQEWEKRGARIGDWALWPDEGIVVLDEEKLVIWIFGLERIIVWLPRPDQLMEMLEERGCAWNLGCSIGCPEHGEGTCYYWLYIWDSDWTEWDYHYLSCPEVAFLRALLEVIEKEDNDDLSE